MTGTKSLEELKAELAEWEEEIFFGMGSPAALSALEYAVEARRAELSWRSGPPPGYIRVKVPVAVDERSWWRPIGDAGSTAPCPTGYRLTYLEGDVALPPAPETLRGVTHED